MFTFTDLSRYSTKTIKQKTFFFVVFLNFFFIALNRSPLRYVIQSEEEAWVNGTKHVLRTNEYNLLITGPEIPPEISLKRP